MQRMLGLEGPTLKPTVPCLHGSCRLRVFPRSGAAPALSRLTLAPQTGAALHPCGDQSSSIRTCWREEKHTEQWGGGPTSGRAHAQHMETQGHTHTTHTHPSTHTHRYPHTQTHALTHIQRYRHGNTHMTHKHRDTHVYPCTQTHVLTHIHRYRHGNTHTNTGTHTCTHVHTCTHTHRHGNMHTTHTGTHTAHTACVSTYTHKHIQHIDKETHTRHTDTGTRSTHMHMAAGFVTKWKTRSTGLTGQQEGADSTAGAAPSAGPPSRPRASVSHVILTHAAGANSSEQRKWRQRGRSLCLEVTRPEWAGGSSKRPGEMPAQGRHQTQARTAASAPFGSDTGWVCCVWCSESKHAWRQEHRGHGGVSREGPGSNTAPSTGASMEGHSTPDPMRGGAVCTPAHTSTCTHTCTPLNTHLYTRLCTQTDRHASPWTRCPVP